MLLTRLQAHRAHRDHRGYSLFEISIVLAVIALASAGIYGLANTSTTDVREKNMIRDIQAISITVANSATQLSTYNGLTKDVIIDGDKLDHKLIDAANDNIVITGSAGNDYIVELAAGGAAANGKAVGADTDRFFLMAIQGVEELQDCVAMMSFDHPNLFGVLADGADAGTATGIPAATATNSWQQPPQNTARELIDRNTADVQSTCTTTFGADEIGTIYLGLR